MVTHLAKDRPKPTEKELKARSVEEDIFNQGQTNPTDNHTPPPIPEPVDPPEDEMDNEEIVQDKGRDTEASTEAATRAQLFKEFGQPGVDEYDKQLKEQLGEVPAEANEKGAVRESELNSPITDKASGLVKPRLKTEQLSELNRCADFILNCLPPGLKKDFETAAFDNKIEEIGVFILGLLNQAYKEGNYYNPDVETAWENNKIGYRGDMKCQFCGKRIVNPKNVNQLFCNNLCAKGADRYPTGVLKPVEKVHPTDAQNDKRSYESELAR